jgi:hypothetical protein
MSNCWKCGFPERQDGLGRKPHEWHECYDAMKADRDGLQLQVSEWKPIVEAARTLIEAEKSDNAGLRFGMDCLLKDLRKAVDGCVEKRVSESCGVVMDGGEAGPYRCAFLRPCSDHDCTCPQAPANCRVHHPGAEA